MVLLRPDRRMIMPCISTLAGLASAFSWVLLLWVLRGRMFTRSAYGHVLFLNGREIAFTDPYAYSFPALHIDRAFDDSTALIERDCVPSRKH